MKLSRRLLFILVALGVSSFTTCAGGGGGSEGTGALNLSEFQRVLRTGLDSELAKIVSGSQSQLNTHPTDQREIHTKRRSNIRGRKTDQEQDNTGQQGSLPSSQSSTRQIYFTEQIWDDLVEFSWKTAYAMKRDEHRLLVTSNPEEASPCPFLVCIRGRKDENSDGESSVQEMIALFDKRHDESLLLSSSHNETCLILTATALQAHKIIDSYRGQGDTLVGIPLVDVTKIHAGTIDEVSSRGWSVPETLRDQQSPGTDMSPTKNETNAINQWERVIVVDLAPGLGGMKEEAELLVVVNDMMSDIQDMGEVGWLRSMDEAEEYLIEESLAGVPSLSDLFSLTSSLRSINGNDRVTFWHDSFKKGIESEHLCSDMFSTLFVKPRPGYYSYDLVMNPIDGPPPQDYESSASNPACITSLIAALSTHPHVLSVEANFPTYHGWHIAHKLDSV